jgi:hypothetical protein
LVGSDLVGSERIQPVAESDDAKPDHREERLAAIVRKLQCTGHDSKTKSAERTRQKEAMSDYPAAESDRRKTHRQDQPDFVNHGRSEHAAGACNESENESRRKAMDKAERRNAHRDSVEPSGLCK